MATSVYTLQDFVREAREIVERELDVERTLDQLSQPLERVIARDDCLADLESGDPDPDRGVIIHRSDGLTVFAVVWPADSSAPVHNHNGWALEGVIRGMELNHNFQRLDDGSEPWRAKLEEVEPSAVGPGQTTSLLLPPNDIHSVEIPAGKTLAIHVYGVDLPAQWRYRFDLETGEVSPYRMRTRA